MMQNTIRLVACLVAAAVLSLSVAGPAAAEVTRPNTFSFGPDGTGSSSFGNPAGLAFHQASKRLYVTNNNSPAGIFGFNASTPGTYTPLAAFNPLSTVGPSGFPGLGVDNTGVVGHDGNVYMSSENTSKVYGFDAAGTALAGYNGASGIDPAANPGAPSGGPSKDICGGAVDPSGNFWVANYGTSYVIAYDSAGNHVKSVSTAGNGSGRPCQMAFDSNGDMYVVMYFDSVWKFDAPSYTTATRIDPPPASPS